MSDLEETLIAAASSPVAQTGTSEADDAYDTGSDLDDNATLEDGDGSLEGDDADDMAWDGKSPLHEHPAWKRNQAQRTRAEQERDAAKAEADQNRAWAQTAMDQARAFGYNSPAEYQAAVAQANQVRRQQEQQQQEEVLRQQYAQKYFEPEVVERLVQADRVTAQAQAQQQQLGTQLKQLALREAKVELGAHYSQKIEQVIAAYRVEDIPGVVAILKEAITAATGQTQTVASAEAAKALARRNGTTRVDNAGAAPQTRAPGRTSGKDMSFSAALAASIKRAVGK